MPSAAALRLQIETALAPRIPGALTPRARIVRDLAGTGIPELDALLNGGLPIGAISELVGRQSSGRTTLALATLAESTQAGKTVAWIDTSDSLDPESAAAAGVDLARQLWVRCGQDAQPAQPLTTTIARHSGAALLVEGSRTAAPSGGCGSPHPRSEVRGLSEAVDAFLQQDVFSRPAPPRDPVVPRRNRMVGTPSAPNRKLLDRQPQDARPLPRRARDREEQIPTDRQPSRRQVLETQRHAVAQARDLQSAQIANTAAVAANRPQAKATGGAWHNNANNEHGRCFQTPPNAIAAGLPRFREMEQRAQGQGHSLQPSPLQWAPSLGDLVAKHHKEPLRAVDTPRKPARSTSKPEAAVTPLSPASAPDGSELKRPRAASLAGDPPPSLGRGASSVWRALDQALRATDLLLTAGGFSIVVLDLGSVPPEFAWRIPLATWFRFRAAADRARAVLLLLTQHPCARSSAELVLRFQAAEPQQRTTVLTGAQFHVSVERQRFEAQPTPPIPPAGSLSEPNRLHLVPSRKQPQRERAVHWKRAAAWTGTNPQNSSGDRR